MDKLFHFDCPEEVYTADACVLSCFDARFDLLTRKFLKRIGVATYDNIKIPGSAKSLAAPGCDRDRDFVLEMVRTSRRLHRPNRALIFAHADCGGYIGVPKDAVVADVVRGAGVLLAAEPDLAIECYFNDFDGVYKIG